MNISLNCKLSLSKKLRALLSKEASLTLVSQDIVDGKGTAILTLTSDTINDSTKPSEIGETSVMLIPVEVSDESPNSQSPVHASIFSTVPNRYAKEAVVQKIAAVNAPDTGEESTAIKEDAEIPAAFSELKNKECTTWIKNTEELIEAINIAKAKKSDIDPDSAQSVREKAILQEMKEQAEAIDVPAWIVNDKVGMLSINDLNISLPLNSPIDLSHISARRIFASKDLKGLLKAGYIRFISPKEKDEIIMGTVEKNDAAVGLGVFDNHEQAMDNIENSSAPNPVIDEESALIIDESDIETKTEDESMILNLTQDMPNIKTRRPPPEGNTKTTHSNTPATPAKNSNIKPISKKF